MSIPRNWRLQQQRYRFAGKMCERCNKVIFPTRNVCPECDDMVQTSLFSPGFPVETAQLVSVSIGQTSVGIPVEVVSKTQNDSDAKVLVYGYQSYLITPSVS